MEKCGKGAAADMCNRVDGRGECNMAGGAGATELTGATDWVQGWAQRRGDKGFGQRGGRVRALGEGAGSGGGQPGGRRGMFSSVDGGRAKGGGVYRRRGSVVNGRERT